MNVFQVVRTLGGMVLLVLLVLTACEVPQTEQAVQPPPTQQPTATVGVTAPLPTATTVNQTTSGVVTIPTTLPIATLAVTATSIITPISPSTPSPGNIGYTAEKISLAPFNLNSNIPTLAAQSVLTDIVFNSWSNSGKQFAFLASAKEFIDPAPPEEYSNIYRASELWIMNINGTEIKKIAEQTGDISLWSSNDQFIAYFKLTGVSKRELWLANLQTGGTEKLDQPPSININTTDVYGDVAWLDNQRLFYSSVPNIEVGKKHLWVHDVQMRQIDEVLVDESLGELWRNLEIAPNKQLVVGRRQDTLWLGELVEENDQWHLNYIKDLISGDIVRPHWSNDGSQLAIKSLRQFENILHIFNLQSNMITEIVFPHTIATVDWSPDDNTVIVSNYGAGTNLPNPIYAVNVDGSDLRELGAFFFGGMKWSPNGQYLSLLVPMGKVTNNPFGILKVEVTP